MLALAVVILYVIIYIVPKVTGLLDVTYVAEYGELSIYDEGTCYLVRNETVYLSQGTGTISKIAEEGTLLRLGTAPVSVSGAEVGAPPEELENIRSSLGDDAVSVTGYYLQRGGIVSYYVDGYESSLSPETMGELNKDFFDGVSGSVYHIENKAYQGYPIFKVVSNDNWYVVAYLSSARGVYEAGDRIFVELDRVSSSDGSQRVEMRVVSAETEGAYTKVILKTSRVIDELGSARVTPGRLVASDERGLLIEKGSLVELDGKIGVYVRNTRNKYDFKPVNIIGENNNTVVISESYYYDENGERVRTVDPFADILRDPSGQPGEPYKSDETEEAAPEDTEGTDDTETDTDAADQETEVQETDNDAETEGGEQGE